METIEYDSLILEVENGFARLTLNDPGSLNALSYPMADGLVRALNELAKSERKIRGLLITGTGR